MLKISKQIFENVEKLTQARWKACSFTLEEKIDMFEMSVVLSFSHLGRVMVGVINKFIGKLFFKRLLSNLLHF